MKKIEITPKKTRRFDVVVIGGGTTGTCAAIAAARAGASVGLIEKQGFLGGNAATGLPWLGFHGYHEELLVGGIPYEIVSTLQNRGQATAFAFDPICRSAVGINAPSITILLQELAVKAGVTLLLHSMVFSVDKTDDTIDAVYLMNKGGCECWEASEFIDATDTGDIAMWAGEDYTRGREGDHRVQVSSMTVTFGGIDVHRMVDYFEQHPDQIRPFPLTLQQQKKLIAQMRSGSVFIMGAFPELVKKAQQEGLPYQRNCIVGAGFVSAGELVLVNSRVEDVDLNDEESATNAELDALAQTNESLDLLRGYIPGCEKARIVRVGHQIGVRETQHLKGVYILTADDLLEGRPFDDVIAQGAYHIDIHSPDHKGIETKTPKLFQIPYRCLLPKKTSNLIVPGRAASATQAAQAAVRVIPISSAMGQAAGCAAALSVREKTQLKSLPYRSLRKALLEQDVRLPLMEESK